MLDRQDWLQEEILRLKREKDILILAHNYQIPEVQDIADFVGDSLELSLQAANTQRTRIVFCGVYFMAETARILSRKPVLMPVESAGCPLANMATAEALRQWRVEHPQAAVVAYINSSAAVKALSDIVCTSANALKIVQTVPQNEVIFLPDQGLGSWIAEQTNKQLWLWPGFCPTHYHLVPNDLARARQLHPLAKVLVHPECRHEVRALADAVLGTGGMLRLVHTDPAKAFIIGTEEGLLHRLRKENPGKEFFLASTLLLCPNMKKTDLASLHRCLAENCTQIEVPSEVEEGARRALERMLSIS